MGNNVPITSASNKSFFAHGVDHHNGSQSTLPSSEVLASTGNQQTNGNSTASTAMFPSGSSRGVPAASPALPLPGGDVIQLDNRDAEGAGLGMSVLPRKDGALQVTSVAAGGVVDSWNAAQPASKSLRPGSIITKVNGVGDSTVSMVAALRKNEVLNVEVSTDRNPEPEDPALTLNFRGPAAIPRKAKALPSSSPWPTDRSWADEWNMGTLSSNDAGAGKASKKQNASSSSPWPGTSEVAADSSPNKGSKHAWPSVSFGGTEHHWPSVHWGSSSKSSQKKPA
mmetsp:Transcript_58408/g.139306  ORF Transcript_58408/g.139306 Transcript_58408/m.139306 type:complete len:282 (-) Transcript_58408:86-931(-)